MPCVLAFNACVTAQRDIHLLVRQLPEAFQLEVDAGCGPLEYLSDLRNGHTLFVGPRHLLRKILRPRLPMVGRP